MASVKLYPRLDKINDKGEAPIYIRLTKNRKSRYIALDTYVRPEDWNEKVGKVKSNAQNSFQLNYYLTSKEAEAQAIALELEIKSKSVTALDIKSRILRRPPSDFFTFVEKYGQQMNSEWSIGNYRKFLSVLTKLRMYNKGRKLYFDEINVAFIRDFQRYLLDDLGNKLNIVYANLKVIRRLLAEAISDELTPYEKNPCLKIRFRTEKSHRLYLLDEELERLKNLKLTRNSCLRCHRDIYVFSADTGGIRIFDLLLMRWRNFDGTHLIFQIKKTQEDIGIKIPDSSLALLQQYHQLATMRHPLRKVEKTLLFFH